MLVGKRVRFVSDCEFFPNFDVTGLVYSYSIYNNEILFKVKSRKSITIGSNMKNLMFEIVN